MDLTGHPDHQAVSAWTFQAKHEGAQIYHVVQEQEDYEKYMSEAARGVNWYFNIPEPPLKPASACDIAFKLTRDLRDVKLQALKAMPSQYDKFFTTIKLDLLDNLFTIECFVKA